ncbi:MAG: excalibur calcium-binding domain-containing protein [Stenotrophomonas sp.]
MLNTTSCRRAFVGVGLLLATCTAAHAHPGGLNKEGCHNDRKNGGYHCHRGAPSYGAPRSSFQPAPPAPSSAAPSRSNGRVFRNCDEARAAGAAPVRRGDPGYGPHLDRDNDGVGCEPYRGR